MRTGFKGHGERLSPNYSLGTTLRDIQAMSAVAYIMMDHLRQALRRRKCADQKLAGCDLGVVAN